MNTRITYQYRDGANYRFHHSIVVAGIMTAELWNLILTTLDTDAERGFIAHQVGLTEVFGFVGGKHIDSEEHRDFGYEYDDQNDHCWHSFSGEDDWELTGDPVTDKRTVEQLVEAFEATTMAGWKVFDPAERFGL